MSYLRQQLRDVDRLEDPCRDCSSDKATSSTKNRVYLRGTRIARIRNEIGKFPFPNFNFNYDYYHIYYNMTSMTSTTTIASTSLTTAKVNGKNGVTIHYFIGIVTGVSFCIILICYFKALSEIHRVYSCRRREWCKWCG